MNKLEAPTNQLGIAKEIAYHLGRRIGGDIEVLGLATQEEIANTAADEKGLMPRTEQAIEHLHGAIAYRLAGNGVVLPGHNGRSRICKGRGPREIARVAFFIRHRA